jgi:hypothetical protein
MYGKKFDSIPFCFKISLLGIFPFYWLKELSLGEIPWSELIHQLKENY